MGILHSHPASQNEATTAAATHGQRRCVDQTYHVRVIRRRAGDAKDKKVVSTKTPTPWEQLLLFMSKTIATWSCPEWWGELETENERLLVLSMLNGVCYEYGRAMVRGRKIKTDWDWIEAQEIDQWNIDGHHIRQQVARYYRTCLVYPYFRVTYLPWDAYESRAAWRKHLEFLQSASAENSLAILRKAKLKDAQPVWDELATLDRLPMYELRKQIANAMELDPTLCKVWTKVKKARTCAECTITIYPNSDCTRLECQRCRANSRQDTTVPRTFYCSRKCQQEHWPMHKSACGRAVDDVD